MPIKVYKVADIIDGEAVFSGKRFRESDLATVLTTFCPPRLVPASAMTWKCTIVSRTIIAYIEEGTPHIRARILIGLPPISDKSSVYFLPEDVPTGSAAARGLDGGRAPFLGGSTPDYTAYAGPRPTPLVYFRDRLFMSERPTVRNSERAEVVLRVKKAVYKEEAELSNLRAAVANLEAAIEFQESRPRRDPIPEDVKLLVWARDGGCCIRCGSKQELHFDHIIPVAKGGGNSAKNIQLLCQTCNLKKSDRIAMP
jgi:hypothetical protein